jgi:hypothetical protein
LADSAGNPYPPARVSRGVARRCGMTIKVQDIKQHMEVLGSDGKHVGTVDCTKGEDRIKLTKGDPQSGGQHHLIPLHFVQRVDDKVYLTKPARQVLLEWQPAA